MCWCSKQTMKVEKYHSSNGEVASGDENSCGSHLLDQLPEHVDNPFLNRNVQTGALGFRYANKKEKLIVYSSIEAKTFCIVMSIKAIKN